MTEIPAADPPTARRYLTGLARAFGQTAIPFGLGYFRLAGTGVTLAVIAVAALIQVAGHRRYFLGIDLKRTPRENLLALAFAAFLIFIMVGGSLWIMFDLHARMMIPT
jgi:cytochrome o ubiquinol oxidase operon protein cyoD